MPLQNGLYVAPVWRNDQSPAIDADELNAMSGAIQGAVEYDRTMALTDAQKTKARSNIGAPTIKTISTVISSDSWVVSGDTSVAEISYSDLTGSEFITMTLNPGDASALMYDAFQAAKIVPEPGVGSIYLVAYGTEPTIELSIILCVIK